METSSPANSNEWHSQVNSDSTPKCHQNFVVNQITKLVQNGGEKDHETSMILKKADSAIFARAYMKRQCRLAN